MDCISKRFDYYSAVGRAAAGGGCRKAKPCATGTALAGTVHTLMGI